MFRIFFYLLIVMLFATNLHAAQWAISLGQDSSSYDEVRSVVFDTKGNLYVAGRFEGAITFGNGVSLDATLNGKGNGNSFIAKYNSSKECIWAKSLDGDWLNFVNNIAVDASGYVYVAGYFEGTMYLSKTIYLTSTGDNDGFVAKFDSTGECQWANIQDRSTKLGQIEGLAVDAEGNSYVIGSFQQYVSFGNGVSLSTDYFEDYLVKYNSSGKVEWAKFIDSVSSESINCVTVDTDGNIYIAGDYNKSISFGNGVSLSTPENFNSFVAKYNSFGECQWASAICSKGISMPNSIAVDSLGNSFMAGYFHESIAYVNGDTVKSLGNADAYIAKFNKSGVCQWTTSCGGKLSDYGNSVAVDAVGNSYLVGHYHGTCTFNNAISFTGIQDISSFIAKYNASGKCVWAENLTGTASITANTVAVDALGNPYAAGMYGYGEMFLNDGQIFNSEINNNGFILQFNSESVKVPAPYFPEYNAESININTRLNWHTINDATAYRVQVSTSSNFTTPITNEVVTTSTIDLNDLLYRTEYYWRMQSLKNSDTSAWSPAWTFTTSYDPNANVWAQNIGTFSANLAVDSSSNFYISGTFGDGKYLGNGLSLSDVGNKDGYIAKYSSLGVCQWGQTLGGSESDDANSVATDANGNVYVVGSYKDTMSLGNGIILTSPKNYNGYIAKYNSSNEYQWAKNLGGLNYDEVNSVAVDVNDNIFVSGIFEDTMALGNNISLIAEGSSNQFLAKYSSSGVCQWAFRLDSTAEYSESISKLTTDVNGNIYIAGTFRNAISFGNEKKLTTTGNSAGFIAKFNTSGECLMTKSFEATGKDVLVKNIAVDAAGNIYTVGIFQGTMSLDNNLSLTANGSTDAFVAKLNSVGECLWAKCYGGETRYDNALSIAVDANSYVYVAGYYTGEINLGNGVLLSGDVENAVACFIKFNTDGKCLYAENLSSYMSAHAVANSVAVDNVGNTYIAGYYNRILNLDYGISLSARVPSNQVYVIKYKAQYLNTPELTAPALAANNISINIPLNWNEVNDVSGYRVQVSTSRDFATPIVNEVISTTSKNLSNLLYNTQYFWRVKALTTTDSTAWSPTWDFNTLNPADVDESNSDFSISPQPVRNEAVITYSVIPANNSVIPADAGISSGISIELYDLKGTIVATYNFTSLSEGINKLRLDVSNIPSGMYNVIIKSGAEVHQAKMIKVD